MLMSGMLIGRFYCILIQRLDMMQVSIDVYHFRYLLWFHLSYTSPRNISGSNISSPSPLFESACLHNKIFTVHLYTRFELPRYPCSTMLPKSFATSSLCLPFRIPGSWAVILCMTPGISGVKRPADCPSRSISAQASTISTFVPLLRTKTNLGRRHQNLCS